MQRLACNWGNIHRPFQATLKGTLGARAALGVLWMRVHAAIGMYLGEHAQTISGNFQGIGFTSSSGGGM